MSEHIENGVAACNEALGKAGKEAKTISERHASVAGKLGHASTLLAELVTILAGCNGDLAEGQVAAGEFVRHLTDAHGCVANLGLEDSSHEAMQILPGKLHKLIEYGNGSVKGHAKGIDDHHQLVDAVGALQKVVGLDITNLQESVSWQDDRQAKLAQLQAEATDYLDSQRGR